MVKKLEMVVTVAALLARTPTKAKSQLSAQVVTIARPIATSSQPNPALARQPRAAPVPNAKTAAII